MENAMEFADVGRHPLLRPESIDGVLTYWPERVNDRPLAQIMPLVNVNAERIELDIVKMRQGGMTPLVADDSESPIFGGSGRGKIEFEGATWGEKVILTEKDLIMLRKIGTQAELEEARAVLQRKFAVIERRLLNRLEWMRRQVLFDGTVTGEMDNGAPLSVTYAHPDYLEPTLTGTDLWSDLDNSDPVGDLQTWVEDYINNTGFGVKQVIGPNGMLRLLTQNKLFRDMVTNSYQGMPGDMAAVKQHLVRMTGVPDIVENRDRIPMFTELTAAVSNGATTIDLLDVDMLEAGDEIFLVAPDDLDREKVEVSSISGNTVTITAGINRTAGFPIGSAVKYSKRIIPWGKVLFVGTLEGPLDTIGGEAGPDADKLEQWADVASLVSRYEDLDNPKPGLHTKTIDKRGEDPGHMEQALRIKALPRVFYNEGWLVATAFE